MKIGDKIWCHDYRSNRRPWFEAEIDGETRMSWIVGSRKINKKTMLENQGQWGNVQWHTEESMQTERWVNMNRHKIAAHVEGCRDMETLRKIAAVVGYQAETPALPAS